MDIFSTLLIPNLSIIFFFKILVYWAIFLSWIWSEIRSQNHFSLLTIGIEFLKPIHLMFLPQPLSRNESGQDLEGMNNKGQTTTLT